MSRVYEPVWVGATGDCRCRYGMQVCNPHSTCTHDMGLTGLNTGWWAFQHLPVSVIESHMATQYPWRGFLLPPPSPPITHLAPNCSQPPTQPLPSPEGCGLACSYSIEGYGRKNTRGDPASGRPSWCVARTGHDSWPILAYPSFLDPNWCPFHS